MLMGGGRRFFYSEKHKNVDYFLLICSRKYKCREIIQVKKELTGVDPTLNFRDKLPLKNCSHLV